MIETGNERANFNQIHRTNEIISLQSTPSVGQFFVNAIGGREFPDKLATKRNGQRREIRPGGFESERRVGVSAVRVDAKRLPPWGSRSSSQNGRNSRFKDIKVEPLSENNLVGPSADKPFSQARAMLAGVAHFSPDAQTTQIFQRLGRIKEEAAVHFSRQVFSPGPTVQPPIINHRKMSPKTLSPSPRKKFLFIKHSAVFIHLNKTNSSS